jgi:membrane peptidoglycan carboxypeptidase
MTRLLAAVSGTLALGLGGIYALHLGATSHRILNEFESLAANSYYHVLAEPLRLRGGTDARAMGLVGRLGRAGLRRVRSEPESGEFRVRPGAIEYRRADGAPGLVQLQLAGDVVASITVAGEYRDILELPPEHVTSFRNAPRERRAPVEYRDLPPQLVTAVLAAEDRRFFEHSGLDWRGILRALARNISHGRVVEGGSTITQQTVKIILERTRRELPAKIDEALIALLVEQRFSKEQILHVYLNNVYLGHEGPFDVHGVAEGARFFFGKPLLDLNEKECYELAAAIRAPNAASPRRHRERLADYTRAIAEAAPAVKTPARPAPGAGAAPSGEDAAPLALESAAWTADRIDFERAEMAYYMDVLEREWNAFRSHHRIQRPATIVASIDPILQLRAAQALERGLDAAAERRGHKAKSPLQGAVVAMETETGALRAVVGGRDWAQAPFNRATEISRQVGSTFKPFVYLTALGDDDGRWTQSSLLPDTLREYQVGPQTWAPANFDREYRGWVTARQALEQSINAPTVALGMEVGVERVARLAEMLGLQEHVPEHPSMLLGALETSPAKLAGAYAALANGGSTVTPHTLVEVHSEGRILRPDRPRSRRVATAAGAYVVSDMLVGALRHGTGAAAAQLGFRHLAGGKTGTSDNARDTWFAGFTPGLVAVVWVGCDDNAPTGLSGASAALPVWVNTMAAWIGQGWDVPFDLPPGVTFREIDPVTGELANSTCIDIETAAYLEDTAPERYCSLHAPSFGDRFDRIFGPDHGRPERGIEPPPRRRGLWWRLKSAFGV